MNNKASRTILATGLGLLLPALAVIGYFAVSPVSSAQAQMTEEAKLGLYVPQFSGQRGRKLFVDKGCVVCHAVNGVGGKAGPPFDAPSSVEYVDVLEFAANMWNGAYAMIELQGREFGYHVQFSGQEIADLAAFVYDARSQSGFSETEIPELLKGWTIDDLNTFLEDQARE